jgi:ParB family transcriptional regulator, chromosome partitioning protein
MTKSETRGLGSLFSKTTQHPEVTRIDSINDIDIALIQPNPFQPREDFEQSSMDELVDSIREKGVLQPLIIRTIGAGKFELIAGERRLRAAKAAGLAKVPVIIRNSSETESLEIALIENLQRADLNALEEARGYRQLIDSFGLSQEDASKKVGRSRTAVANALRLLDLPKTIQDFLSTGKLTAGHCRALLACKNQAQMEKLANRTVAKRLSVRQLEALVYTDAKAKNQRENVIRKTEPHIQAIEQHLSEKLGTKVIVEEGKAKGKIVIEFYSNEDFERILEKLGLR